MGRFSKVVFGKEKLLSRCIIYAGAYIPSRKEWVRNVFDGWKRIKGNWVKCTFATKRGREYFLVFNVYGGAMTLELLHLLKDGGVKKVFLIGSLGGKDLPIRTIVVPTAVVDKAGLVGVDDSERQIVKPEEDSLMKLRDVLRNLRIDYVEGKTVSVPCVLHNINRIKEMIEQDSAVLGVDIETSTFYHFSKKIGFESYALLYISDNQRYDVISRAPIVQKARKNALRAITHVAIETLK
jgi:purine-nucleoside phosphorylase